MKRLILPILLLLALLPAVAQDSGDPEEEKSVFLRWVEDMLSTPNRRITISQIDGVLSSNARIGRITIADREGVWFTIEDAEIVWTRSALLAGRLSVDRLAAANISMTRRPLPDEGAVPSPEASGFSVPDLPVSVRLDELAIERVAFGEEVFGLRSELSVAGNLSIDSGSFSTDLDIERLDGPGGSLDLVASFDGGEEVLDVDLKLAEPENGVLANLLNIHQRPAIGLALAGSGPVNDLALTLALDADGRRVLDGEARIAGTEGAGKRFDIAAEGPIGELVDPLLRDLFGQRSTLAVIGETRDAGGLEIERLSIESGALTLSGSAATAADGFPTAIALAGTIRSEDGRPVVLPVPGGTTRVAAADLDLSFGAGAEWRGTVRIDGFATGGFGARQFQLGFGGTTADLDDPARRALTVRVDGEATGLSAEDPGLAEAMGERAVVALDGSWRAGEAFRIADASLQSRPLEVGLAGAIADMVFDGTVRLETPDAAVLSELSGRDLAGGVRLTAEGRIAPVSGAFDLVLDGALQRFRSGEETLDRLIDGDMRLTGRAARDENGLRAENLRLEGGTFTATADGHYGSQQADMRLSAAVADLARLTGRLGGRLEAEAHATGSDGRIRLDASLAVPSGTMSGRSLDNARIDVNGMLADGGFTGALEGNGFLAGERLHLASDIAWQADNRRFSGIELLAGASRLTGDVALSEDQLWSGQLDFDSSNLSTLAAMLLQEASGQGEATIRLDHADGRQNAGVRASFSGIRSGDFAIGEAEADLRLTDLFGVPGLDGTARGRALSAAGFDIDVATVSGTQRGETTDIEAGLRFANGTSFASVAALTRLAEGFRLDISNADLVRQAVLARLRQPATIEISGGTTRVSGLALDVSGGRVMAEGTAGERMDFRVVLDRVPLAVANEVRPDLGLGGMIDGTATVAGTMARPDVTFEARGRDVTAAALRQAGLPAFAIDARGNTDGQDLKVDASMRGAGGIDLDARGTVPLGSGNLALTIDLNAFPLAVLEAAAPGQGLGGRLTGSAEVTGRMARPSVTFDLRGTGIRARPLVENGVDGLEVSASGRFADEAVTLTALNARGAQGLAVEASGRVPLSGSGLDLRLSGSAPLALANRHLAGGAAASGTLRFDGRVTGSLASPRINGSAQTADGAYSDPSLNIGLRRIQAEAALEGDRITIRSARAEVTSGGSVTAGGTVSIDTAAGMPADLVIRLDGARYVDGAFVVATLSGDMRVSGALLRDPLVAGTINIDRAELLVPDNLGGAEALEAVRHVRPSPAVQRTLRLARADDNTPVPTARPSVARLDLQIVARNRIFVRGRGLDAELGGSVRIAGPVNDVQPIGGFELIRGRLAILGKRIVFDRGQVTLVGDLDPFIDFVATSEADDVTVYITVNGRVSDPAISFSSRPELPQDEVLARLIFGRSIAELSVVQVAKLAASAAELAGGGNNSLLGSFRQATGLDELDLITDSGGNAAVRAGRYIQDNIYLGVEAGASGETRATINIDITEHLKAKGATGSNGDSSVGVFFERDY